VLHPHITKYMSKLQEIFYHILRYLSNFTADCYLFCKSPDYQYLYQES